MQTPDIKKLLQRKRFKGSELGKVLMMNKAQEMERWKYGTAPKAPLFTNEELQYMKNGLRNDQDILEYNEYAYIYNLTTDLWNSSMNVFNKVFTFYWLYVEVLKKIDTTEKAFWDLEKTPVVITRSDYEAMKASLVEKALKKKRSPADYMAEWVFRWVNAFNEGEKIPAPLKKVLTKLKKEKCTNKRLLDNFAFDIDNYTYCLPKNKTLTPKTTLEDYRHILIKKYNGIHDNPFNKTAEETARELAKEDEDYLGHKKGTKTLEEEEEDYKRYLNKTKKPYDVRAALNGDYIRWAVMTQNKEMLEHISDDTLRTESEVQVKEWLEDDWLHSEKVKSLSKLEALEDIGRYFGDYEDYTVELDKPDIEPAAQIEEFIADYPELYKLLLETLEDVIPEAKGMKPAELLKPLISIEELHKRKIDCFDNLLEPSNLTFAEYYSKDTYEGISKYYRAWYNGFAITEEDTAIDPVEILVKSAYIDEAMKEDGAVNISTVISSYKKKLEDLYKRLHAHNTLLDIICRLYGMPFLYETASFPISTFEVFGDANLITTPAFNMVYGHLYGNTKRIIEKAEFINRMFPENIFNAESKEYDPAAELVEKVETKLAEAQGTLEAHKLLEHGLRLIPELLGEEVKGA